MCAGALALGQQLDKLDVESEAAAWGTACHEVSEKCLRTGLDADSRVGATVKTKSHSIEVDDEMAECAQVYVDYVRGRLAEYAAAEAGQTAVLWIEERFTLAALKPPFDAGGTGDSVLYFPLWRLLETVDLKGGRGIKVEVTENKQLRTYSLGAMLAHSDLDVEHVQSTIVQPRMEHKDGRIRSEEFHVTELMEWTAELVGAMRRSAVAMKDYSGITGELSREAWGAQYLKQGSHCTFCPGAAICPALEKKALDTANAFFGDSGKLEIRNQPGELDPARLRDVLDGADALTGWLNAVRAMATRLAQTGTEIPGYILTDKIGRRRFKDSAQRADGFAKLGLTKDDIYDIKLKSPAQMEKLKGADGKTLKGRKEFNDMVETPTTGVSLVSASKTTKAPVKSSAEKFFA